ncbi:ABC transporter permease [Clostridium omnivorum]|uniref:ABC transporter permease n=1 Tax=Clostridium omnivorum TaxID=1604902 RepID=A0ABQ5N4A3_9CLOT|nr:FtsX-like permease family protein [Clostridium sp. E14]GLC30053.1 ABC transporter permease [Clostridium sp. E14]
MINSYKQLTGRYLKANKKRSLLTLIGIILSVALISSIGLFFKGIQVSEINSMKDTYGSYHLMYLDTNEDLVSKVINNPKVGRYGFYGIGEGVKVSEKLTVNEVVATDKALELMPYKAKEGKLPQNQNEAAIEKWVLSQIDKNAKVGSKIKFNNKEYTLVGILEDVVQDQMENKGVILTKNNTIDKKNSALLVEVSSKTNLKNAVKELKQLGQKDKVIENVYLLSVLGATSDGSGLGGLYLTIGIIIAIVVIATIAVIYNSFQISIVERIKQFGLLRAVGSTPKQIRRIVLREATALAIIGVPLGLLCGIIAIYGINITFKLIGADTVLGMKPVIDGQILALSAAVGAVSIYISALIPAVFAGRISPLVAISSRATITKEKIKKRKNKIVEKIFGFEGAMAAKNIKRNRKRYRVTVFSIVISVVLFVTFKSFMDMTLTISSSPNESKNIHFSVVRDQESTEKNMAIDHKLVDNIKALSTVDKVYEIYNAYTFDAAVSKASEVKEVQDIGTIYKSATINGSEKSIISSSVVVYDKDSMEVAKKFLKSGNIDIEKLNSENGVILIGKSTVHNDKTKRNYYGSVADLKVGDEIDLQYFNPVKEGEKKLDFGKGNVKKVKVMAILQDEPFNYRGNSSGLKLITTDAVAKSLVENAEVKPVNLNIKIKDIKKEEAAKTEIENTIRSNPSLQLVNNIDNNRRSKTGSLMIQILIYGFVVVVSLIGSVNIINTLTTNILLRKREFAALKSIGMTQKGLRKMIILEGLLYGIVGTIYGSIISCGLSYMMFRGLNDVRELGWTIPWGAIAIAGSAALVIGYLSVLSPLSRIKKENLIDTIREDF